MCDILLVNPRSNGGFLWETPTNPPLGLCYLASMLEDDFDVKVVDFNTTHSNPKEDVEWIIKSKPKIIGIGVNTPPLPLVYEMVCEIKKNGFKGGIMLGGPHITARPETMGYFEGVVGLRGEGELEIKEVCKFMLEGNLVTNRLWCDECLIVKDLDSMPYPSRHLLQSERYRSMHVVCSRGCPYDCTYCSTAKTDYRRRSPKEVADEVMTVKHAYPDKDIGFSDDVFTLDVGFVSEFCGIIKKRGCGLRWSCTTRVDLVDGEMLREMHDAGCWHISFGVESGVEDIRYSLNKRIENEKYKNVFNECRKTGIRTRAYAIFGHPTESIEDMHKTIDFVLGLRPDDVVFSLSSIYPGTVLAMKAIEEGLITKDEWERRMLCGTGAPVYRPGGVGLVEFRGLMKRLMGLFNLPPSYAGGLCSVWEVG